MKELTFPLVGSIRVNLMRTRWFTGTQEMYARDGVVHAHSCLLNGAFTSRDGSVTGVYASVFIPAETYNSVLAEKSVNSVVEVRCMVKSIDDKTSQTSGKAYREANVDEEGPKRVICNQIEDADDYFGGDLMPVMVKRSNSQQTIKV